VNVTRAVNDVVDDPWFGIRESVVAAAAGLLGRNAIAIADINAPANRL